MDQSAYNDTQTGYAPRRQYDTTILTTNPANLVNGTAAPMAVSGPLVTIVAPAAAAAGGVGAIKPATATAAAGALPPRKKKLAELNEVTAKLTIEESLKLVSFFICFLFYIPGCVIFLY